MLKNGDFDEHTMQEMMELETEDEKENEFEKKSEFIYLNQNNCSLLYQKRQNEGVGFSFSWLGSDSFLQSNVSHLNNQ
ncbi:hypothetical protein SLE2022_037050 [Rubroshorea leprosula]